MSTIAEIYKARMAKMSTFVTDDFKEELEVITYGSDIYQQLKTKIEVATGKKVFDNFTFRSGKVMGLLATAAYSPKQQVEVCSILNISPALLEMFRKSYGRLPYLDKDNNPVEGIQMDCDILKNVISMAANNMGLLLEEEDLDDINEERWRHLWDAAMEKQLKNEEFNSSEKEEMYKEE